MYAAHLETIKKIGSENKLQRKSLNKVNSVVLRWKVGQNIFINYMLGLSKALMIFYFILQGGYNFKLGIRKTCLYTLQISINFTVSFHFGMG